MAIIPNNEWNPPKPAHIRGVPALHRIGMAIQLEGWYENSIPFRIESNTNRIDTTTTTRLSVTLRGYTCRSIKYDHNYWKSTYYSY